jgi:hypothetical protein
MIDETDFITKTYISKDKTRIQKWYMHYCDVCGTQRNYAPKNKTGKCISCACKGRIISEEQKQSISNTMTGVKIGKRGDALTDDRRAASRIGMTLEEYHNTKIERDAVRRCKKNLCDRLVRFLKNTRITYKYLSYSGIELREHLKSLWQPGMTWDNYGKQSGVVCWEIDHIIPLKYQENGLYYWNQSELSDPTSDTFKKAWALDNLQPMWAIENHSKLNKYIGQYQV